VIIIIILITVRDFRICKSNIKCRVWLVQKQ
jgi:hypothetical protein